MSTEPTDSVPSSSDVEVSRWVRQLQEAETHLRELLGDNVNSVLDANGPTFLRQARKQVTDDGAEARRHEAMLKDAQRIARFGCWELDLMNLADFNANPLRWSDEVFRIFGFEPGEIEVSSENFFHSVHPDDRVAVREATQTAIREGKNYLIEHRIILPNGTIRYVHEEAHLLKDPVSGRAVRMLGIVQDITERREREEALRLSEERFTRAFEYAPIGIALVAPDGTWLKVNQALCLLTGYSAEELLELSFQDITHPDDLAIDLEHVRQVLSGEISHYQLEKRYFHKQGHIVWVLLSVSLVRDNDGAPLYFVSQILDISKRKLVEQQLEDQAALLDEARDAIILRDWDQTILFWNKGAERLYGWTAAEAIGQKATKLFYASLDRFKIAMGAVVEKGAWMGELDHITKSGNTILAESRWTLLRDPRGRPKAVLCINTDLTERKRMESHLLRAQRIESIGTLAGGIAHDLNNLLSPILMGVDLLKHFGVTGPSQRVVEDIERSARRGSSLVKQVLSFARGVEGAHCILQIKDVIAELESIIENTFPKNITLETRIPKEALRIKGDPTQINQVLLNLCVNSRDAMPRGGLLTVSIETLLLETGYEIMGRFIAPGSYVCIGVTDTGHGIPKENLEKIFDPFFTTKELTKGTGLGLATTLSIVRSHGGFLNVESEVGKGTTFKVYLPAQTEISGGEPENEADADYPRGNGEWILLIEDEISILTVTQQMLETFGYHVLTAGDGADALNVFATHQSKVALVITDMMMPVMDGNSTIAALRKLDPHLKIITTSGLNSPGYTTQSRTKYFLTKPYTTGAMLNLVKTALMEKN